MGEKLTKLYNTLCQIETKGENTKLMALCLSYTAQLINEVNAAPKQEDTSAGGD
jgi:hypothetical protein